MPFGTEAVEVDKARRCDGSEGSPSADSIVGVSLNCIRLRRGDTGAETDSGSVGGGVAGLIGANDLECGRLMLIASDRRCRLWAGLVREMGGT